MNNQKIRVTLHGEDADTAYIELPGHPGAGTPGCVSKTIRLDDLMKDFQGPMVNFDLDKSRRLIGIEIIVFSANESENDSANQPECHGTRKD
jgi:uncharacterized protein YuzE